MQNETLSAETGARHREAAAVASRYWLAKHAYLCVARGQVVLLDLKRDKYLSVPSPGELASWVSGWPVAPHLPTETPSVAGNSGGPAHSVIPASLSRLVRDEVLTSDPALGKPAELATIPRPRSALVQFQFDVRPRVNQTRAIALGRAWLTARIARRRLSMQRLVERVQERKARESHRSWDAQQARDLVTTFLWLRPLYYRSRGACLLDSLVLLELLAQYGLFPSWVYGIKLAPFAAHCWIQNDDVVLNDTPEHAAGYTPILCV